jgi:hypothetical protein
VASVLVEFELSRQQPSFEAANPAEFHAFDIGRDEVDDVGQSFNVLPITGGHVGYVSSPPGSIIFFEPDSDDERMGHGLKRVSEQCHPDPAVSRCGIGPESHDAEAYIEGRYERTSGRRLVIVSARKRMGRGEREERDYFLFDICDLIFAIGHLLFDIHLPLLICHCPFVIWP